MNEKKGALIAPLQGRIARDWFEGNPLTFAQGSQVMNKVDSGFIFDLIESERMKRDQRKPTSIRERSIVGRLKYYTERAENREVYRTIQSCIKEGRIRLILLLNTTGGNPNVEDGLTEISTLITQNVGDIITCCREKAHSLGAELLLLGDQNARFIEEGASLLFHKQALFGPDTNVFLDDDLEQDRLTELITRSIHEQYVTEVKLKIEQAFRDSDNEDSRIVLSAEDCQRYRMAKVTEINPAFFVEQCGIDPEIIDQTPIVHFCR